MDANFFHPLLFSSIAAAAKAMLIIGHRCYQSFNLVSLLLHRGHPALMPEHSEPGYVSAITAGADFIECDVHFTR